MPVMKYFLFPVLFLWISFPLRAQLEVKDEPASFWFLQPHVSGHLPAGDMKQRFYPNGAVGFGLQHKTASQWLMGIDWTYLFAEKVRNEDQILKNITTSEGFVIDQTGVFANIHFRQRGFYLSARGGRLFTTRSGNPNSGILLMGSVGYLQHKIRIEVHENTSPQLDGDYMKGYDKLTGGPGGSLFLGYLNFSDSKLTNFTVGIEYLYAQTVSLRSYDFVLMKKDETRRNDQLWSLKFCWNLPVYARAPKEFYTD
jgi:hypothetical protein